jgi:hypothetical protein
MHAYHNMPIKSIHALLSIFFSTYINKSGNLVMDLLHNLKAKRPTSFLPPDVAELEYYDSGSLARITEFSAGGFSFGCLFQCICIV